MRQRAGINKSPTWVPKVSRLEQLVPKPPPKGGGGSSSSGLNKGLTSMIAASQISFGDCSSIEDGKEHSAVRSAGNVAMWVTIICILFAYAIFNAQINRRLRTVIGQCVDNFFIKTQRWLHRLAVASDSKMAHVTISDGEVWNVLNSLNC